LLNGNLDDTSTDIDDAKIDVAIIHVVVAGRMPGNMVKTTRSLQSFNTWSYKNSKRQGHGDVNKNTALEA
jgi:hypothetical protein